jgi:hypothetical protein
MNSYEFIRQKTALWAKRHQVKVREPSAVDIVQDIFKPWAAGNLNYMLVGACGVRSSGVIPYSMEFQVHCEWLRRNPEEQRREQPPPWTKPVIDVLCCKNDLYAQIKTSAVLVSFAEAYNPKLAASRCERPIWPPVNPKEKLPWQEAVKESMPRLEALKERIEKNTIIFQHMDVARLLRCLLWLQREYGKSGFSLTYLWYDVPFDEGTRHRKEIQKLQSAARRDRVNLNALTVQELVMSLASPGGTPGNAQQYLDGIAERYL